MPGEVRIAPTVQVEAKSHWTPPESNSSEDVPVAVKLRNRASEESAVPNRLLTSSLSSRLVRASAREAPKRSAGCAAP